jgi:outer membrane usher protein
MATAAASVAAGPGAQAQPGRPATEQLIANVRANHVDRGEAVLLRQPDGDWWIAAADAQKLRIPLQESARRRWQDEAYVSLRALGAVSLAFDEAGLALEILFPQAMLPETRIDLSTRPPPVPAPEQQLSLIMSYRLGVRPDTGAGGGTAANLLADVNLRVGKLLLRQELSLDKVPATGGTMARRGPTQAIWDDLGRGTRTVVGDTISSAGAFGSTITAAGVGFSRLFSLTPDVIVQPTAAFRTSASGPSDVEVSVDGTTLYRSRVPPGPVALDNLLLFGGSRTVRVTVTDPSGRREVIEQPFLFTDAVLAAGLHEFAYFAGRRSVLGSTNEISYAEPAWQAFHRYGASDRVTVSAGGEGNRGFSNAGAGAALRSDVAGLFAGEVLASRDQETGATARGWATRYTYQTLHGAVQLGRRRYGEGYRTFGTTAQAPFLRSETAVSASTRLLGGVVSGSVARQLDALGPKQSTSLRWSRTFSSRVSFSADLLRTRFPTGPYWSATAYLRFNLDPEHWVTATTTAVPGSRVTDVSTGRQLLSGEGFGWRVGTSHADTDAGSATAAFGAASWNARSATVDLYARSSAGAAPGYTEGVVSGSFVAAQGWAGFTRPVQDGFAVARLGVPQEGIAVRLNNQLQGTTDASGLLLIPNVGSYGLQTLTVDEKALGMEYLLPEKNRSFSVPYRGGATIDFAARRQQALVGPAWLLQPGGPVRLATGEFVLSGPGGRIAVAVSRSGEFYLENIEAGTYTGAADVGGRRLRCTLTVPRTTELVSTSKEGLRCE